MCAQHLMTSLDSLSTAWNFNWQQLLIKK